MMRVQPGQGGYGAAIDIALGSTAPLTTSSNRRLWIPSSAVSRSTNTEDKTPDGYSPLGSIGNSSS